MDKPYMLIKIEPYEDARGKLIKIAAKSRLTGDENIEEVYILYTSKGAVRGNHYHKKTVEYFSVLSGMAKIVLRDMNTRKEETVFLSAEDNIVIKIPEYTAHTFQNENEQPLILVAVSTREYKSEDTDTFQIELIKKT